LAVMMMVTKLIGQCDRAAVHEFRETAGKWTSSAQI